MVKVSTSGFYVWLIREPSKREETDQQLVREVKRVFDQSDCRYGSPTTHKPLQQSGLIHLVGGSITWYLLIRSRKQTRCNLIFSGANTSNHK